MELHRKKWGCRLIRRRMIGKWGEYFGERCLKTKYTSACIDGNIYAVVVMTANLEERK